MATVKKPKYLMDEAKVSVTTDQRKHYVRAWKEGRGNNAEIVVQVWFEKEAPEGEPDGDWGMPASLGLSGCVGQAILQTQSDLEREADLGRSDK